MNDQKILRAIRDLRVEYDAGARAKQPFVEFEPLSLTAFTIRILQDGIDVMKYRMIQDVS
jgi:hypothetical protein